MISNHSNHLYFAMNIGDAEHWAIVESSIIYYICQVKRSRKILYAGWKWWWKTYLQCYKVDLVYTRETLSRIIIFLCRSMQNSVKSCYCMHNALNIMQCSRLCEFILLILPFQKGCEFVPIVLTFQPFRTNWIRVPWCDKNLSIELVIQS